jgi:hypothetical protein
MNTLTASRFIRRAVRPLFAAQILAIPFLAAAGGASAGYTPSVLYGSYFGGGNGQTFVKDIKVNAAGEVYLAGYTSATDLPGSPGPGQTYRGGYSDGFIAKFAADMRTLIFFQYVGTAQDDEIHALALDAAGNAYLAGFRHPSLASFEQPCGDAVLYKASYSGFSVGLQSDSIGGADNAPAGCDQAKDVAVAPDGSIVLAGHTSSASLPGAAGVLGGVSDGFVARYDANLYRLGLRYLHQAYDDGINAVDIGSDGWISVAGWSSSASGAPRHAWAARLNQTATAVAWSQAYQGNGSEEAFAVRVNSAQQAWVAGVTSSSNFAAGTVIDPTFAGPDDGFVMRLLPANGHSDYRSYVGGPGSQRARSIDIAANGDVLLAGANQPDAANGASAQAFLLRLNAPQYLSMDYTVQYGDPGAADVYNSYETIWEREDDIAMTWAPNQSVYLAGLTRGSQFSPITANAWQPAKPTSWLHAGFFLRVHNGE